MLHPSYSDLVKVINADREGEEAVGRYSIVIAAAKRARQIVNGSEPLIDNWEGMKPLSIAVEEIYQGKVNILGVEEVDDEISFDLDFVNESGLSFVFADEDEKDETSDEENAEDEEKDSDEDEDEEE